METITHGLLSIVVLMSLSGCLINTPPGVRALPEPEEARVAAQLAAVFAPSEHPAPLTAEIRTPQPVRDRLGGTAAQEQTGASTLC